jgi:hypothetical protein
MGEGIRPPLVVRGSRRRLRQIRLRGNWSTAMWWLVIWLVGTLWLVGRLIQREP